MDKRDIGAIAMIPLRNRRRKKVKGRYRKLMLKEFDEGVYHRRSDRMRNKEIKLNRNPKGFLQSYS